MRDKLSPEHQQLLDKFGIDGETTLKDAAGQALHVSWSEAGNFIFLNPGGWGDGKYYLTTLLFNFLVSQKPAGLCLHETAEGCQQLIEAAEMEKLRKTLIQRYTHNTEPGE